VYSFFTYHTRFNDFTIDKHLIKDCLGDTPYANQLMYEVDLTLMQDGKFF